MELWRYWQVFRRRWLLLLIPAAVVLAVGLATYQPAPPVFNVGVRFLVAQPPTEGAATADEQRYYNWLVSEYIVNGLGDWVRGREFAGLVSQELVSQGLQIPAEAIQITADNVRSMLTLSMSANDPTMLEAMMNGTIQVLMERNAEGLPQLGGETAVLVQLDPPIVGQIPGSLSSQLELPLRIAIALAVGVGLALLVEYLDPTVRGREELVELGLPVMGEIPDR